MTIQEMKQKKKELGYTNEMVSALYCTFSSPILSGLCFPSSNALSSA